MTTNLLEFDLDGLAAFCERLGEKRFRATQLFRWIHQRGASDFDAMSDLAKALRDKLKGCARVEALPVISEHVSSDGTVKWLFDVGGGNAVEAVLASRKGSYFEADRYERGMSRKFTQSEWEVAHQIADAYERR